MKLFLGNRLKKIRKLKSLTQQQISEIMNVTSRTYQHYELNEQKPAFDKLANIVNRFKDINPNWLFTGEGEMFKSDSDKQNISSGMNPDFIEKLKEDLQNKDDSFYASLSMSKDKLFNVLFGKVKLTRVEVIELARKLNRSLNEYIALAGYMPEEFKRIAGNQKALALFRSMEQLTDAEMDQVINSLADTIRQHFEKKKEKEKLKNQ